MSESSALIEAPQLSLDRAVRGTALEALELFPLIIMRVWKSWGNSIIRCEADGFCEADLFGWVHLRVL